ncbi:asparaginase [Aureimonas fodinaquatilis]|uniref:Asparaginase n=1 Tax=Aureimonas fodinaquatilis TaxID=2565783 RepID=A0A5B0E0F6_9HYPH|nr:asparaginase [Aureimonas fodinaquatilis]KAA0972293.1 asparaginase [Aureimonas fodinaquatilis]
MSEPMLIEVTRGKLVESRHNVHVAVVDASGGKRFSKGDVGRALYPRSAVKVLQALPLIETGAADAAGLTDMELALACASHSGEEQHALAASRMLDKVGLDDSHLECGCHWPFDLSVAVGLAQRGGVPTALHNNCSGKHAGFLCTAVHLNEDPAGYAGAGHKVQQRVRAAMADTVGVNLTDDQCGIDGCSIPTYAAPLDAFALAFARLVSGQGVSADRARAGQRLINACMAEPYAMSGKGRMCLALIEAGQGRVFAKTGAEGVFCGAVPELGLGFTLKAEDGTTRAAESAAAATLAEIFRDEDAELAETFRALAVSPLRNWQRTVVGEVRPAVA